MSLLTAKRRAYVAVQVTLTGGADNLLDLVNAVLAGESSTTQSGMVCPGSCMHLTLQNANAAAGAGVNIGDALISSSRFGYTLAGQQIMIYRAPSDAIQFSSLYALGTADDKLNIEVMTF